MSSPTLVTGPEGPVVSLPDLKTFLRVDHEDEDDLIVSLEAGAVAWLERSVLGRCIMPQTWSIAVRGAGPHALPFPDASDVEADMGGVPQEVIDVTHTSRAEKSVMVPGAGFDDMVTITGTYGLPEARIPTAQVIVKLLVGHWFSHREAVVTGTVTTLPMAVDALLPSLRWRLL